MSKVCNRCERDLPVSSFTKKSSAKDGLCGHCRECAKAHYAANADHIRARNRAHYANVSEGARDRQRERLRQFMESNPDYRSVSSRKHRETHPDKVRARQAAAYARRAGRLVPLPCAECGAAKVEAHHEDYSKPLDVVWLCRTHHIARHRTEATNNRRNG